MNTRIIVLLIVVIAALMGVALWQRNTITAKAATIEANAKRIEDLTKQVQFSTEVIDGLSKRQLDNDAIAVAVAAKLNNNAVRHTETRTVIERAVANEPSVRAWGDDAVPASVRDTLNAKPAGATAR